MDKTRINKALYEEAKVDIYKCCLECRSFCRALSQYRNYLSLISCGIKGDYNNDACLENKRIEKMQNHIRELVINNYKIKYIEEG